MIDRRLFVQQLTAGALAAAQAPAGERVRVGVIGAGGRGPYVASAMALHPACSIVAVCDVYQPNAQKAAQSLSVQDIYGDYHRVLERKDIDAVIVATPDHWHCPITVEACAAGKDVYVEKPLSNEIEPCLRAIGAARQYNRVVQVGLQQRNMTCFQKANALLHEGLIGKVSHAALAFNGGGAPPEQQSAPPPADLDWEMFQGPAPRRPYTSNRQRNWRNYYDYGGGLMTDWGVHLIDIAIWMLGADEPRLASGVCSYNGTPRLDVQPDLFSVSWKYDDFLLTFANYTEPLNEHAPEGTYFYGQKGMLLANRSGYLAKPRQLRRANEKPLFDVVHYENGIPEIQAERAGTVAHAHNFIDCVKSRQKPACDLEAGFRSTLPTLLAIQAMRTSKTLAWDGRQALPA